MKQIYALLFTLILIIGFGCGSSLVDTSENGRDAGNGTDDTATTTAIEETVAGWLNGWESGSAAALISYETARFLEFTSAMREELYESDFQVNSYSITNKQITVDSYGDTLAKASATFHIEIVGPDDVVALNQDNSWSFNLVKDNDKWLISSYEDSSAS
jgi:hypothetical protein